MRKTTSLRREKVKSKSVDNSKKLKKEIYLISMDDSKGVDKFQSEMKNQDLILKLDENSSLNDSLFVNELEFQKEKDELVVNEVVVSQFEKNIELKLDEVKKEIDLLGVENNELKNKLSNLQLQSLENTNEILDLKNFINKKIINLNDSFDKSFQNFNIILKNEILSIKNLILPKSDEIKAERTLSFQLGQEIINSGKSVKSLISLPKKLFFLKNEAVNRKKIQNIKKSKDISLPYLINKNIDNSISYKKLKDLVSKESFKFDGNLFDHLGIKDHASLILDRKKDSLSIKVISEFDKPKYFQSENLFTLNDLRKFINNDFLAFNSSVISENSNFAFIVYFLDESKKRISLNFLNVNKKLGLKIPENCKYIYFGLKISGNSEVEISNVLLESVVESQTKKNEIDLIDFKDGISIVIPVYKAEKTIAMTLDSIFNQKNIDNIDIEVICVINGEQDNSCSIISNYHKQNSKINVELLHSEKGASSARNLGVKNANYKYLVFLDSDDVLSDTYLSDLYNVAGDDKIGICYINDLDSNGYIEVNTTINKQILNSKKNANYNNCSSAITMIASKIIPTKNAKKIKFNENLRSGEDVSYFSNYIDLYNPKLEVVDNVECAYIRRLTDISVSRQPMSFDFNVIQRLDVIKEIEDNSLSLASEISKFSLSKINAQIGFIIKYLEVNPNDKERVIQSIVMYKFKQFPYPYFWKKIGMTGAEQLVFSYCHPPFVDTSATIVAKRVNEFGLLTDVVANDMSTNRKIDSDMMYLDKHYINDIFFLNTPTSFGSWNAIKSYALQSNALVKDKSYKQLYSRVLWPASNFAAFEYKLNHLDVKWVAEFSDPVVLDIEGNERVSELNDIDWVNKVLAQLPEKYSYLQSEKNVYVWCELLAYLFSDELIFTCENQRSLMLSKFKYPEISEIAYKKSIISPHPKPNKALYSLIPSNYYLDNKFVNIGYFGVFYKNRKLDDLINMLQKNDVSHKDVKIHIFTNNVNDVVNELTELKVINYFKVNNYVGYFEFLNICKKMDLLIVNDAKVTDIFGLNPYLPSKMSDYIGSNKSIWAFVEDGSALSKSIARFKTTLGDSVGFKLIVSKLIEEKFNKSAGLDCA